MGWFYDFYQFKTSIYNEIRFITPASNLPTLVSTYKMLDIRGDLNLYRLIMDFSKLIMYSYIKIFKNLFEIHCEIVLTHLTVVSLFQ